MFRHLPDSPGKWAVIHAAVLGIIIAWNFGGMSPSARLCAEFGVLPALLIAVWAWRQAGLETRQLAIRTALPLALLCLQVGISFLNPSTTVVNIGDTPVLRPRDHISWLPSSFYPAGTWRNFVLNVGFFLTGFNLLLARPRRRWLRGLLTVIVINAAILACVGSFFKLLGVTAVLNIVPSPNPHFFASFIYHNHWGAFALLALGCAGGLFFYYDSQRGTSPIIASPCPTFALAALLIALALPLSSSRSATSIGALILIACLALAMRRAWRRNGHAGIGFVLAITLLFGSAGGWFATHEFQQAFEKTQKQLDAWNHHGAREGRLLIYRDTLKLVIQKPFFGWGWNSFQHVYPLVQSPMPRLETKQTTPTVVLDAHNDWLQFLAENGAVGLVLALATLAGILRVASFAAWQLAPSREILLGIAGLSLMALIDFPMACPAVTLTAITVLFAAAALARGKELTEHSAPAA